MLPPTSAKQSMYDLSDDSAKELAVAEKHESGDRPNNQRALMSDTMGTRYASAIALKIATSISAPRLERWSGFQHADNCSARARPGAILRVRDGVANRVGSCIPDWGVPKPIAD